MCGRELLYGVAHLLGWSFDVQGAPTALGTSSIPPATTMFFELHFHEEEDEVTLGAINESGAFSEASLGVDLQSMF